MILLLVITFVLSAASSRLIANRSCALRASCQPPRSAQIVLQALPSLHHIPRIPLVQMGLARALPHLCSLVLLLSVVPFVVDLHRLRFLHVIHSRCLLLLRGVVACWEGGIA